RRLVDVAAAAMAQDRRRGPIPPGLPSAGATWALGGALVMDMRGQVVEPTQVELRLDEVGRVPAEPRFLFATDPDRHMTSAIATQRMAPSCSSPHWKRSGWAIATASCSWTDHYLAGWSGTVATALGRRGPLTSRSSSTRPPPTDRN